MAQIAVFGGTGFVGRNIVHEAAHRGHDVLVVTTSTVIDASAKDDVSFRKGSVFDPGIVADVARWADVVALAVRVIGPTGARLSDVIGDVARTVSEHGGRLAVVGGSGSLRAIEDGPRLLDGSDFPAEFLPEARTHADALDVLQGLEDGVDWFVLSPPADFGAQNPGTPTGAYRVGGDVMLVDDHGRSTISGADYARAFLDEIESPQHRRERFTVGY